MISVFIGEMLGLGPPVIPSEVVLIMISISFRNLGSSKLFFSIICILFLYFEKFSTKLVELAFVLLYMYIFFYSPFISDIQTALAEPPAPNISEILF